METTVQPDAHQPHRNEATSGRDSAARLAGILLILTALATIVAVFARVSADTDQATLGESLAAIADHRILYGAGGIARLVAGITLIAGAWYLSRTWVIREGWGNPLVPVLFAFSAVFTAISGIAAAALAISAPVVADPTLLEPSAAAETINLFRWLAGKIGFAVAGLALLVAARQQWKGGGKMRRLSPLSAIIGLAMQFIWIDSATFMHPINGTGFVLWLLLIGSLLTAGFVERHFSALRTAQEKTVD
ncbi:MAG: hypothetical protein OXM03_09215 [Chloroflexota bacterium]|nr:hypothetical protein [Chloroflexota bacterium]MDE2840792.1 hypothetical protein [Chloroflexota bacterium]MDE2931217.1 hypothetical protein [Chloroflexota bacterium]